MRSSIATLALLCIWLPGCSMTGMDAQKSFSCKAPPGISCSSLSGVYANAVTDNLPNSTTKPATVYNKKDQGRSSVVGEAPTTGAPLLSVYRQTCACGSPRGKKTEMCCTTSHSCTPLQTPATGKSPTARKKSPSNTAY